MTAYRESLEKMASPPSYITAADTLNTATKDRNILESAVAAVEYIPKFAAVSLISGIHQLVNAPVDMSNWLTDGNTDRIDTDQEIANMSSDLGQFYQDTKGAADLVGFVASSLVPGTAGVKVLQVGQKSAAAAMAGKVGTLQGRALGLLVPQKQKYLAQAVEEVANGMSRATLGTKAATKAIASGFHQNALEALAFETAVAVTMFKSPILENQDMGDFFTNVALGAGLFGGIAAGIDAIKLSSALGRAADDLATEARPWTFIEGVPDAIPIDQRLAIRFEELSNIPAVPKNIPEARQNYLTQSGKAKTEKLNNLIRGDMAELTGKDQVLAEAMYQEFKAAPLMSQHSAAIGAKEIVRVLEDTKLGKRVEYLQEKLSKGKHTVKEAEEYAAMDVATRYIRMWGDEAGTTYHSKPIVHNIADSLKKGEKIEVKLSTKGQPYMVTAGKREFEFNAAPGFNIMKADILKTQARYIAASKMPKIVASFDNPIHVDVNDIPMLEKVVQDGVPRDSIKFVGMRDDERIPSNLMDFLGDKKSELAYRLLQRGDLKQQEIATMVNIKSQLLEAVSTLGAPGKYHPDDILAMQHHAKVYTEKLIKQGEWSQRKGTVDIWNIPQTVKATYDHSGFNKVDNFVVEGMTVIAEKTRLAKTASDNAAAKVLGDEVHSQLQDLTSGDILQRAVPSGAGHTRFKGAGSDYGSLAAQAEQIGQVVVRAKEAAKAKTKEVLSPLLYKLGNDQKAAIEWSVLNAEIRSIEGNYGLNAAGDALEPLDLIKWKEAAEAATAKGLKVPEQPILPDGMKLSVPLQSQHVRNLVKTHIELNGERSINHATLKAAQGMEFARDPRAFYPLPVNPKEYPHYAMVTDDTITSGNHSKTLYASTAEELDGMILRIKELDPRLTIRTKRQAEEWYSARGQFDYEKTLTDNYLDTAAHRAGVSAPYIVPTNPQKIIDDTLNWHLERDSGLVNEAILTKYETVVEELKRLGDEATNVATSKLGSASLAKYADEGANNPYAGYVKTMLGIRKDADYPWWVATNKLADKAVSTVTKKAREIMSGAKTPAEMNQVNQLLEDAGYTGVKYDETMDIFANAKAAQGDLTGAVRMSNALLATSMLRWDVLNAVNNAVSSTILTGAEMQHVLRAIESGDARAVGKLTEIAKIKVPGTDKFILSPTKLYANAIKAFDPKGPDMAWFKERGYITNISKQYADTIDSIAYRPGEPVKTWTQRMEAYKVKAQKAGEFGEKYTGNTMAEEFNRFASAHIMKQITDIAIDAGIMTGKEQLAYINTFVNRTQGNYLAAQRPGVFQGAIGQAVGLFQTYQFNLIQQLLRYTGTGKGKDIATLMALQGTIHGMNGLPAFNAMNTHIIGTASGNSEYKDVYDTVYGAAGKEGGDWLMYGLASNALGLIDKDLKLNLYTRGDINPRHVTLLPTSPAELPIIQASGRFFSNLARTANTLMEGGDVTTTLLQGLEHNALSRPLAGLAVTLKGLDNPYAASYSTSKQGNVVFANDMLSLVSLGRIAGGKPLDEAVAVDAMFRVKAYEAKEGKRKAALAGAIKSTMVAGQDPSSDQIDNFVQSFTEMGGTQKEFNKWAGDLYRTANLSQTNKLKNSLSSPFAQKMQVIMGGEDTRDFSE